MGLFKKSVRAGKAVLTLGKSLDLEQALAEYERLRGEHLSAVTAQREAQAALHQPMERLGRAKRTAIRSLRKARRLIGFAGGASSDTYLHGFEAGGSFAAMTRTIDDFEAGVSAAKGLGLGAVGSAGAWALVSTFGTASTGASIGGLGGIAATNATLAWFGGGSLATGGGGMLAGGAVIGGIVILPMLAFGVWKLNSGVHGQLKGVNQVIIEIRDNITLVRRSTDAFLRSPSRIATVTDSVAETNEFFRWEYKATCDRIYPWPLISRVYRYVRRWLTGQLLSPGERHLLVPLENAASLLIRAVNQQVFNSDGLVTQEALTRPPRTRGTTC